MKTAILSMDIEDWFHLDYFDKSICDRKYTMLDGLNVYHEIISNQNIKSSFFVLGELASSLKESLVALSQDKHDIGSHGWGHLKPLTLTHQQFVEDITKSKEKIEDIIGIPVKGYRAPCFNIDRSRLDLVAKSGYLYDSSYIDFSDHPLYGSIDLKGYESVSKNIFRNNDFFEFQVSTQKFAGKNIPVSGGGYIRISPWFIMNELIRKYLNSNDLYIFYIHPFEFSKKYPPILTSVSFTNKIRFSIGRSTVPVKFDKLIDLLNTKGFKFTTFCSLREDILSYYNSNVTQKKQ